MGRKVMEWTNAFAIPDVIIYIRIIIISTIDNTISSISIIVGNTSFALLSRAEQDRHQYHHPN